MTLRATCIFFDNIYNGIRKLSPAGQVTRFVGGAPAGGVIDGTGAAASFANISGMVMDSQGNIYACEYYNHVIRKITPGGVVTTIAGLLNTSGYADGTGSASRFSYPNGIAVDDNDNLYVMDNGNRRIRKITPSGVVTTLAGNGSIGIVDGPGASASFSDCNGIDTDSQGNIYVSETSSSVIRKITPAGNVSTHAGSAGLGGHVDGTGSSVRFYYPMSLAIDKSTDEIYVAQGNNQIRKITTSLKVSTVNDNGGDYAGDGRASDVGYDYLGMIVWGPDGTLSIADEDGDGMGYMRRYSKNSFSITPELPAGMTFDRSTGEIGGSPTGASPLTSYEATASNHIGQHSMVLSFSVEFPVPLISYNSIPGSLTKGEPVNFSPINLGGAVHPQGYIKNHPGLGGSECSGS